MVAESLSKALGSTQDSTQIKRHTRKVFVYFGNYLIDLAHLRRKVSSHQVHQYLIKIHGIDNLEKALESGRPLVFAGLHFGNWDVGLELLTSLLSNRPTIGVVSPMRYMALRKRIDNRSSGNYREVVGGRSGLALALRVLKEGGVVVTMLDGPGSAVTRLPTQFLRGTALLSTLPSRLAQKSQALVIPTALAYLRQSEFAAFVGTPVEVPEAANREALAGSMQAMVTQLEPWVRLYPAQWYCFHQVWQQDSNLEDDITECPTEVAVGMR
jgi:KDO2-lipid IV(A) lauroyltransferase